MTKQSTVACPACHEEVFYKMGFVVRKVRNAKDVPQTPPVEQAEMEDFYRSEAFICPCCGQCLQFKFSLELVGVDVLDPAPEKNKDNAVAAYRAGRMSETEFKILEEVTQAGLMEPFTEAVKRRNPHLPKDMRLFFITFLRSAMPGNINSHLKEELMKKWNGKVSIYRAFGIAMLLVDGQIRLFCLAANVDSYTPPPQGKKGVWKHSISINGQKLHRGADDFLARTRFGYVPNGGRIFLEALLHSIGHRGHEVKPIPLRDTKFKG